MWALKTFNLIKWWYFFHKRNRHIFRTSGDMCLLVPHIYQMFDLKKISNVYFFNLSFRNVLFEKMIIFSPVSGISWIEHIFQAGGDKCFLCKRKKTAYVKNFFSSVFTRKVLIYHLTVESSRLSLISSKCWSTLSLGFKVQIKCYFSYFSSLGSTGISKLNKWGNRELYFFHMFVNGRLDYIVFIPTC